MTYSIVARDQQSGELGVAVQSHWFSVGPLVPWARPGVGAVATQANALVDYGPRALDLMAAGASASEALAQLTAADAGVAGRQVAIVDANGETAAYTGAACIPFAGHVTGEQVSCQANIMANTSVWPQMLWAFSAADGPLAGRLLAALDAAEAAGGDLRGRQSAAILVVPAAGAQWDTVVSLRVEDHPEPLTELRRLLHQHDAYELASRGDEHANEGRHDEAAELYRLASELAPGNHELLFWSGLGSVLSGDVDRGVALVREAIALHPGWAELLPRLSPEVAPGAPVVCDRLGLG
ncbi:MAG TPA: DUF1028 domain-containing protein [Solirubrobacteraceae bacterium]|nr:DUF1028 domain-containing protein [Solirubrobacteraceae bacterium]